MSRRTPHRSPTTQQPLPFDIPTLDPWLQELFDTAVLKVASRYIRHSLMPYVDQLLRDTGHT